MSLSSTNSLGKTTAWLSDPAQHRRVLLSLSLIASLATFLLTAISAQFPPFDASPKVLLFSNGSPSLPRALASTVLRWDAFYFAHIAREGYVYEQEWAFFPGSPLIMRMVGSVFPQSEEGLSWELALLGGLVASSVSAFSVLTLYDLSLLHLGSPDAALLSSALSLLPSSPVTLRLAGCSEPFFTALSYQGMLHCARGQWLLATLSFACAGAFRSNGILLCAFILWGLVAEPLLVKRQIPLRDTFYAAFLSVVVCGHFAVHQYTAYRAFCTHSTSPAEWCASFPPTIYAAVQSKYWYVGFLRYWTPQQIPNFLLGAPPLALLFAFTGHYLRQSLVPRTLASFRPSSPGGHSEAQRSPFLHASLAPHALHAFTLSLILLFASHTQIVLRFAAAMPITYWAAAWLLVEWPRLGQWWVGWSVVYGAVSCVLWANFLPPA
ncbi:glycosyltransferase family 76 protein [Epithele typhae]|uniref:glycosyltransferase family 76 protein n=1 Tax=Epithele typhae TaxID=378194 RepID=UPI002008B620|nr:glycosyltransferase family 76 protein [Epithele typhae]KAH9939650.1 glycosyltransferase family 76 protein [Epithele typhae]